MSVSPTTPSRLVFEQPNLTGIAERLAKRLGMGSRPDLRRTLYERLEGLVEAHGEAAYDVIASALADSNGKDSPGNYFAAVVCARLREKGILPKPHI